MKTRSSFKVITWKLDIWCWRLTLRSVQPSKDMPPQTSAHWPNTKLVMLDDVTDSIIFTMASHDSVMPDTCAQCEPALNCEESREPITDQPILSHECQSSCKVLGCEHRSHQRTSSLHWCPSKALVSSPYVAIGLLIYPLCSWHFARTFVTACINVPSWRSCITCATWVGCS